MKKEPLKEN